LLEKLETTEYDEKLAEFNSKFHNEIEDLTKEYDLKFRCIFDLLKLKLLP